MSPKNKATVLLIEDDFDLMDMYKLILKNGGYRVVSAVSAQEAVDRLDETRVDLIVLDILLPAQNGINVLHELRSYSDWRKIPVVILSNIERADLNFTNIKQKNLGIAAYLNKPKTRADDLIAAVNAII